MELPVAPPFRRKKLKNEGYCYHYVMLFICVISFFLHLLHVGNRRVIPIHQTLNPTDTKQAAVNTNMHIIMHMTQSMKAKKKLGSRPLRKNFKNLENCMTETTNMMTATKMVKLQYA